MPGMNSQTDTQVETIALLQAQLDGIFSVASVEVFPAPEQAIRFRGHLQQDSQMAFDELSRRFELLEHTPMLAREDELDIVVAMPGVVRPKPSRAWINLALFAVTVMTTLWAGSLYDGGDLLSGAPFAFTLLLILGTHEFGHYFAARHHRAAVTLPYFIPMPAWSPLLNVGTMGAVIQLRSPIKDRKQLFDIGVAGPLAGLVVALPLLIYGLSTSPVQPTPTAPGYVIVQEGNSLLYLGLKYLIHGKILPSNGLDVSINSVTFAAWFGLLVTNLNLLPMGQLDGGHIAYALWGRRAWWLARVMVGVLLLLGVGSWSGWLLWAFMPLVFGLHHPPPLDDHTPLDQRRKVLGMVMLVVFILVFIPVPFEFIFT